VTQKCILNERKKDGCQACTGVCSHRIALMGLSGTGGRVGSANIPKGYRDITLKTSPAREEQAKVYAHLERYVATFERQFDEDDERIKSLYLYSQAPGTGKTTSASALANEYLIAHYIGSLKRGRQPKQTPVFFLDINELQTKYNLATMTSDESELNEVKATAKRSATVDFLICDDIGIRGATESFRAIVHSIINARTTTDLPTVYTSNVPITELKTVFDERLADRIGDMCLNLAFTGESKRGKR